jgi:hypothetical protein
MRLANKDSSAVRCGNDEEDGSKNAYGLGGKDFWRRDV